MRLHLQGRMEAVDMTTQEFQYSSRRGTVAVCRSYGKASEADVFEELIWKVLGKKVKLVEKQATDGMAQVI